MQQTPGSTCFRVFAEHFGLHTVSFHLGSGKFHIIYRTAAVVMNRTGN